MPRAAEETDDPSRSWLERNRRLAARASLAGVLFSSGLGGSLGFNFGSDIQRTAARHSSESAERYSECMDAVDAHRIQNDAEATVRLLNLSEEERAACGFIELDNYVHEVTSNSHYTLGAKVLLPGFNPLIELPDKYKLQKATEDARRDAARDRKLPLLGYTALGSLVGAGLWIGLIGGGIEVAKRAKRGLTEPE